MAHDLGDPASPDGEGTEVSLRVRVKARENLVAPLHAVETQVPRTREQNALLAVAQEDRLAVERAADGHRVDEVRPVQASQLSHVVRLQVSPDLGESLGVGEHDGIHGRLTKARQEERPQKAWVKREGRDPADGPPIREVRPDLCQPNTSSTNAAPSGVRRLPSGGHSQ